MARKRIWLFAVAVIAGFVWCSVSSAVITALIPLKRVLAENDFILIAKVEKIVPEKPAMVLSVSEDLKGKFAGRKLAIRMAGNQEAKKGKHLEILLKRLAPDLPLILFIKRREEALNTFVYTNGTWFQILGRIDDDTTTWRFLNCEPYLRRTFKGTTAELRQAIVDGLSGKKEPPPPDEKEAPGYGPEVPAKKAAAPGIDPDPIASVGISARRVRATDDATGSWLHGSREPAKRQPGRMMWDTNAAPRTCLAVIPTLGVGAPLVVLAALFPSVFGGALLLLGRWLAFFTVISFVSLIYMFHWLLHDSLRGTWWGTDDALWYMLMAVVFLGVLWAWTRWLTWASDPALPSPGRAELIVLLTLCGTCILMLGLTRWLSGGASLRKDVMWGLMVSFSGGIAVGTIYKMYRTLMGERRLVPELSIEGLMLWGSLIGFIAFAAERGGVGGPDTSGRVVTGVSTPGDGVLHPAEFVRTVWEFKSPDNGGFVSSATLHGEHVFIAAAHPTIKKGTLYCLDRATGKKVATFIDGGEFIQPYSTPFVADSHLYIGEGFHTDPNCKLYCLDIRPLSDKDPAKRKFRVVKRLETTSQTEASPIVANGKVYFGAGNDGFFCADTITLEKRWGFPKDPKKGRLLRFGSAPAVDGDRVFVGTGVDREQKEDQGETALFCLDADSGGRLWKLPTDLPVWATPVARGDFVYAGLGNGDIVADPTDSAPAGAMLCVKAQSGEQVWRIELPKGVLERPAVDQHHVYFGCRDGYVYCVSRATGKERWKTVMGSAVVTAPALAKCSDCDHSAALYVVASEGRVCCLDPATGKVQWTFTLEGLNAHLTSSPRVEVIATPEGDRRRIYFGTALGDGPLLTGTAVVYCLEDRVKER